MRVIEKSFDSRRPGLAIVLLAADATARFDGGIGRRKGRAGRSDPTGAEKAE